MSAAVIASVWEVEKAFSFLFFIASGSSASGYSSEAGTIASIGLSQAEIASTSTRRPKGPPVSETVVKFNLPFDS